MTRSRMWASVLLGVIFASAAVSDVSSPSSQHVLDSARRNAGKRCEVRPTGGDDTDSILRAFESCNNGGTVVFPESETYQINTRLHAKDLANVHVDWRGKWLMSPNMTYWRRNSWRIEFQNHRAGIIFSGANFSIDGHSTGGVDGNGDVWYTAEAGRTKEGRPMPFVLWNVSSVTVRGFSVWQPPLWAVNVMNGTNLWFEDIYVNATATKAPWGQNWVPNTDGWDTMDVRNATMRNLTYQGGDDCIAIKPRSFDIKVDKVFCRGGNGIAIGSLGQYLEDASVENVTIENVKVVRYNEDLHNSAYVKTWVGEPVCQKGNSNYESDGKPRGGGWGRVRNIVFRNFHVEGADRGPSITQDNGNSNKKLAGTSKLSIEGVLFENFEGWLQEKKLTSSVNCSKPNPCKGIEYRNVKVRPSINATDFGSATCRDVAPGGVKGLKGKGCET